MALTYNSILGKLWRLCCRRRTDDRLASLRDKLMRTTERISPATHKAVLKAWLQNSYKATDAIVETIESTHRLTPALYRDPSAVARLSVTEDSLRSLARAPTTAGVAAWSMLLTQLHVYDGPVSKLPRDDSDVPEFLPLTLSNGDIFANLPHLFSPGMQFSLKASVLLAALCHLTDNKHLAERARSYLVEQKGKYLSLDDAVNFPEIMAEETVKIMYRIREFLTPREAEVYEVLYRVSRVRRASRMDYSGKFPQRPTVANLWPDYKIECTICGFKRSFTLMCEGDVCGTCQSMRENPAQFGSYVPKAGSTDDDKAYLATCRSCTCIYEVVVVADMKTSPKCHYCRVAKSDPVSIQCCRCTNRFLNPGDIRKRLGLGAKDPWTCFICEREPKRATGTGSFSLFEMAKQNRKLMENLDFHAEAVDVIYSTPAVKNLKMFTEKEHWNKLTKPLAEGAEKCKLLIFRSRLCLNSEKVIEKIVNDVTNGDLTASCQFCFDEKDIRGLTSPCGKCENKACATCLTEWFGNLKPGALILTTYLTCAFCKQIPAKATIERYNPTAKALVRGEHLGKMIEKMDPNIYYGWCKGKFLWRGMNVVCR